MKYKQHIATGALAISLLVSGSNVYAATPRDLGIKNSEQIYQKQNKSSKIKNTGRSNNLVGIISSISNTGFAIDVSNPKTKTTSSFDVKTDTETAYSKNGVATYVYDLSLGQKVIVSGGLDKATKIINAKTVKIA